MTETDDERPRRPGRMKAALAKLTEWNPAITFMILSIGTCAVLGIVVGAIISIIKFTSDR